jgi:hypothetical protein
MIGSPHHTRATNDFIGQWFCPKASISINVIQVCFVQSNSSVAD